MSSAVHLLSSEINYRRPTCLRPGVVRGGAAAIGLILIAAVFAKILWPADIAKLQAAFNAPHWLSMLVVQAEMVIGVLLLVSGYGPVLWLATASLFSIFAGFSLYLALSGVTSCGCFGRLQVNPWAMFTLDAVILAFLAASRRTFVHPGNGWQYSRVMTTGILSVCPVVIAAVAMGFTVPSTSSNFADTAGGDGLVILEPEQWIGKQFSLAEHLSANVDLAAGSWTLLFYHHDCPKCLEVVPRYEELASESARVRQPHRVLLVEVPPFEKNNASMPRGPAYHARLSDRHEWFVQTPTEISLRDGIVTDASADLPSLTDTREALVDGFAASIVEYRP